MKTRKSSTDHGAGGRIGAKNDFPLRERNRERESVSHLGSLGGHMNQGSDHEHMSADTLPELMNQGPHDKRSNKTHVPLRELAGQ